MVNLVKKVAAVMVAYGCITAAADINLFCLHFCFFLPSKGGSLKTNEI